MCIKRKISSYFFFMLHIYIFISIHIWIDIYGSFWGSIFIMAKLCISCWGGNIYSTLRKCLDDTQIFDFGFTKLAYRFDLFLSSGKDAHKFQLNVWLGYFLISLSFIHLSKLTWLCRQKGSNSVYTILVKDTEFIILWNSV